MKKIIALLIVLIFLGNVTAMPLDLWWKYNARVGITDFFASDLDGDGMKEVVAGSYDGYAYLLDGRGNLIWKFYTLCPTYSVYAADVTPDYGKEVLLGSCSALHLMNSTGEVVWRFSSRDKVERIFVDNKNIIFTTTSGNKQELYVLDGKGQTKWKKTFRGSPFHDLEVDDGEIIFGAAQLYLFNSSWGLKWDYNAGGRIKDISLGEKEIVVGTHRSLEVLKEGELLWEQEILGVNDIEIADNKILVGSEKNLSVFNQEGKLLWSYPGKVNSLSSGDLDGDGVMEIVAGAENISLFDNQGNLLWEYSPYRFITEIEIVDLDSDGVKEILVGALDHNVYAFKVSASYLKEKTTETTLEEVTTTIPLVTTTTSLIITTSTLEEEIREEENFTTIFLFLLVILTLIVFYLSTRKKKS